MTENREIPETRINSGLKNTPEVLLHHGRVRSQRARRPALRFCLLGIQSLDHPENMRMPLLSGMRGRLYGACFNQRVTASWAVGAGPKNRSC